MDFEILPQLIIVISTAGILLIIGKNFSKAKEATVREEIFMESVKKAQKEKEEFLYLYKRAVRRINKENYQKKMAAFWLWFEKFLRKLRITFLKLDGKMVPVLENLRKKNTMSIEMLKETERNIRKNMENENFSKFWNVKKSELKNKNNVAGAEIKDGKESPIMAADANADKEEIIIEKPVQEAEMAMETKTEFVKNLTAEPEELQQKEPMEANSEMTEEKEDVTGNEKKDIPVEQAVCMEDTEEVEEEEGEKIEGADSQGIRTKKEKEYIEMLMKNPADIRAYWKLGLIYSKRRNYDDALACFKQITKIDPTYTKAKQKAIELMEKMRRKGK